MITLLLNTGENATLVTYWWNVLAILLTEAIHKTENILNELVTMAKEICRQNVASTNWFLLAAYDEM